MDIKGIVSNYEEGERAAKAAAEKKRQEDDVARAQGRRIAHDHMQAVVVPVLAEARDQLKSAGYPVKLEAPDSVIPGEGKFNLECKLWMTPQKSGEKLTSYVKFNGLSDGKIAMESHVHFREDGVKREQSQALDMFTKESVTKRVEDFVRDVFAHQARVENLGRPS